MNGGSPVTTHRTGQVPLVIVLGLLALVIAACQGGEDTPSTSSAEAESSSPPSSSPASASPAASALPSEAGGAGDETSVLDLDVGDCFTADTSVLDTVLVVDCADPHVYEVYHVFDHEAGDGDAFPGEGAIQEAAAAECEASFEPYVGLSYQDSQWYGTTVPPNESTWAEGDREVLCLLHLEDESEVTGSAEGSGQ
jgi:hypothetical protein